MDEKGLADVGANPRVCLDFGTSFSKAGVFLGAHAGGEACLAPLRLGAVSGADHAYLTPTALFLEHGRVHCGPKALMRARASVRAKRDPMMSFKMVLSARDVEGTLALKLSPTVDPTRTLTYRDALVLYFAYLDQLLRAAIRIDEHLPSGLTEAPLRVTSPLWRREHEAEQTLSRLFHDAEVVSAALGSQLIMPEGASVDDAMAAVKAGEGAPRRGRFAGLVSEVQSVAAAYAKFARPKSDYLLVLDIGAGTTDISAFRVRAFNSGPVLEEIRAARRCCAIAGDEIDDAVIHQMLRRSRASSPEAKARVWRALRLSARELKHDLIERGKCTLADDGQKIGMSQDALLKDPSFKDFCRALVPVLTQSMNAVADEVGDRGGTILVCIAGGGAHLPIVDGIIAEATKKWRGKAKVITERFSIGLARNSIARGHDQFDKSFSQIVIALGGAIADLSEQAASAGRAA